MDDAADGVRNAVRLLLLLLVFRMYRAAECADVRESVGDMGGRIEDDRDDARRLSCC